MNELLFNAGGRHDYSGSFEKRTQLMVNCLRYIYLSNSFVTIVNLSERLNVNRKQRIVFLMNCKNQSASNQNQKALGCSFSGNKTFILIYNMKFIISQSYIK